MSLFDDLESAAANIIVNNDLENAMLYRYAAGGDGFNSEYEIDEASSRPIKVAISRGSGTSGLSTEFIGTTPTIDILANDVIEIVNERAARRRYVVRAIEPVRDHTYLELDEVRTNGN